MDKVLVINASARGINSHSRNLTEIFTRHWKSIHSDSIITYRELGKANVPHITEEWIIANSKREAARSAEEIAVLKLSNIYISELHEADVIVIGTPMYNWSIPSSLKAYIDQTLRVHETFEVDGSNLQNPYVGLLRNKKLFLLLSRGADEYEKGEQNEHMNFQSTYLKMIFNVMGISNIHMVAVNGTSLDQEKLKETITKAQQDIRDLIEQEYAVSDDKIHTYEK